MLDYPDGFPLPPRRGYRAKRRWLAVTYTTDWDPVSATLADAVDPCELAQAINLDVTVIHDAAFDVSAGIQLQEVRIAMELDEPRQIWRVTASLDDFITTVQPERHPDAVEDFELRASVMRVADLSTSHSKERNLRSTREIISEAERVGRVVQAAYERSPRFRELHLFDRPAYTWGGLAHALAHAERIWAPGDPFLGAFTTRCAAMAEDLRPGLEKFWRDRLSVERARVTDRTQRAA